MASSGENNGTQKLAGYDAYGAVAEPEHGEGEPTPILKPTKQPPPHASPPTVNLTGEEGEGEEDEHVEHEEDEEDEEEDEEQEDEAEHGKSAENGARKKRTSSGAAKGDNEGDDEEADEHAPDSKKPRREYGTADTTTQEAQESVDSSYGAEDSGSNGSEHGNRNQH